MPTDIAREKQTQLAQLLASLESDLASLERAGIDTEATLTTLIDLITEPGRAYANLSAGLRRTYNQAWFTRIYIDSIANDPTADLGCNGERTLLAEALEGSRRLTLATLEKCKTGPVGPAELMTLGMQFVKGSIKNPLVEPRGLEPLTPCLQSRCATNCAMAPDEIFSADQTLSVASAHTSFGLLPCDLLSAHTAPATTNPRAIIFFIIPPFRGISVGVRGLEPRTSSLSGKRSNQAELYALDSDEDYPIDHPIPKACMAQNGRTQASSARVRSTPPSNWAARL